MTISPALFPAVTVTVVRDRKIRTTLRTNQIAGFVTVPSWKKNKTMFCSCHSDKLFVGQVKWIEPHWTLTNKVLIRNIVQIFNL